MEKIGKTIASVHASLICLSPTDCVGEQPSRFCRYLEDELVYHICSDLHYCWWITLLNDQCHPSHPAWGITVRASKTDNQFTRDPVSPEPQKTASISHMAGYRLGWLYIHGLNGSWFAKQVKNYYVGLEEGYTHTPSKTTVALIDTKQINRMQTHR